MLSFGKVQVWVCERWIPVEVVRPVAVKEGPIYPGEDTGQAHISNLSRAISCEQDVVAFQVKVHNVPVMQIAHPASNIQGNSVAPFCPASKYLRIKQFDN